MQGNNFDYLQSFVVALIDILHGAWRAIGRRKMQKNDKTCA
jgi:hypothetical protein